MMLRFERRPGANVNDGGKYEYRMAALLQLKLLKSGRSFMLGSNIEGLGALDDIFIRVEQAAGYCIQLKHKKNAQEIRNVKSGKYSVLPFYKAYCDIEDDEASTDSGIFGQLGVSKFYFILYTNSPVIHKSPNRDTSELSEIEKLLCTGPESEIFSFGPQDSDVWDLRNRSGDKERYRNFLRSFLIFSKQANAAEVRDLVTQEVEVMAQLDTKEASSLTSDFLSKIETWWSEENYFLSEQASLWYTTLRDHINSERIRPLDALQLKFQSDKIHLMSEGNLNVIVPAVHKEIRCFKIWIKLREVYGQGFLLVSALDAIKKHKQINAICQGGFSKVLIINVDKQSLVKQMVELLKPGQCQVILVSEFKLLLSDFRDIEDLWKLKDLLPECQEVIVNHKIELQGYEVSISKLANSVDMIADVMVGKVLATLIHGDRLTVGIPLPATDELYIHRTLFHHTIIKKEILNILSPNDIFAVSHLPRSYVGLVSSSVKLLSVAQQSSLDVDYKNYKEVCKEWKHGKNIHWLMFQEDFLLWKETCGRSDGLEEYVELQSSSCQKNSPECYHHGNLPNDWKTRLRVVTGPPGMGKSTLLRHFAVHYKAYNPETWVLLVPLSRCTMFLDRISPETVNLDQVLDMFIQVGVGGDLYSYALAKELVLYSLKSAGNVSLFLDAVDEVAPRYKTVVVKIILLLLQETKVGQVWITSRTILEAYLKKSLPSLQLILQPFNSEQQISFLQNYLAEQKVSDIASILDTIQHYKSSEGHIFDVPLHAQLAADTLLNMQARTPEPDVTYLSLNLHEMYENFFILKHDMLYSKFNLDPTNPVIADDKEKNFKIFMENHTICALLVIFSDEQLRHLGIGDIEDQVEEFLNNIEKQRIGIIDKVMFGKPQFVHLSYAEYLVAQWLKQRSAEEAIGGCGVLCGKLKNYFMKSSNMLEVLFEWELDNIRLMFDHMVAGDCKLHQAVLRGDLNTVEAIHEESPCFEDVDSGGRLAIHLAASHGRDDILEVLVSHRNTLDISDTIFNWRPLRFADRVKSWKVVIILLKYVYRVKDLLCLKHEVQDNLIRKSIIVAACADNSYVLDIFDKLGFDLGDYTTMDALYLAVCVGDCELAKNLMKGDSNIVNNSVPRLIQESLLHGAAQCGQRESVCFLLDHGASILSIDESGGTPLHVAAKEGHSIIVQLLIERGAPVEATDHKGETPLHRAAFFGRMETAKLLTEHGASIESRTNDGDTPLHMAAKWGSYETVEFLLDSGANLESKDKNQVTPFHMAAMYSNTTSAKILKDRGADVGTVNQHGHTPLHTAALFGFSVIPAFLIECGVNVQARDKNEATPLHAAAFNGHTEIVKLLMESGACIDAVDNNGESAIQLAAWQGHFETVAFLIENGANVESKNNFQDTLLHTAALRGHTMIAEYLIQCGALIQARDVDECTPLHWAAQNGQTETAKLLIKHGVHLEAVDKNGGTPLHVAALRGNSNTVAILLECGANIESKNNSQESPLHRAAMEGHTETVKLLIDRGAHIDVRNEDGVTPLHLAASRGHTESAKLLIDRGAFLGAENIAGETPLHIASWKGSYDIVEFLLQKGADVQSKNNDQVTPLHMAAFGGHSTIVKLLIDRGAAIESKTNDGKTPLHMAAMLGRTETVDVLIQKGANVHAKSDNQLTPLHMAVLNEHMVTVLLLMEHGAAFES